MEHADDVQAHLPGDLLELKGVGNGGQRPCSFLIFHYFPVYSQVMIMRFGGPRRAGTSLRPPGYR